jgi:hypothetical protein
VFWFSLQLLSETFLILRRIRRDKEANSCFRNFADAPNKCVFLAGLFSWCTEVCSNDVYKKNIFFLNTKINSAQIVSTLLSFKYADYVCWLLSHRKTMYDIPMHGLTWRYCSPCSYLIHSMSFTHTSQACADPTSDEHFITRRQCTVSPTTPAFSANMLPEPPPPGGKLPYKPATWNLKCKWNEIQLKRTVKFNSTTAQKQAVSLTHEWAGDKHLDYTSRGWRQRQGGLKYLHPEG